MSRPKISERAYITIRLDVQDQLLQRLFRRHEVSQKEDLPHGAISHAIDEALREWLDLN